MWYNPVMNTIIWHDSGIDVCQQDTMVLYVKDTGTDDVTGLPTFKLGKARGSGHGLRHPEIWTRIT